MANRPHGSPAGFLSEEALRMVEGPNHIRLGPIHSSQMAPQHMYPWYLCEDCGDRSKGMGPVDDCCPGCGGERCIYIGQGTSQKPPGAVECEHPERPEEELCMDCPRRREDWCTCFGDFECEEHRGDAATCEIE